MTLLRQALEKLQLIDEVRLMLGRKAPMRVVVDTSLQPDTWYVVRGESAQELADRLERERAWQRAQDEKRRLAGEENA